MSEFVVPAESRTETGTNANRRLRERGLIPGIVYGPGKETVAVAVSPKQIGNILRSASGENTLFDIELSGAKRKVILKECQVDPIGGHLLHADFFEVALDKIIQVKVPIELQGTPVGVKVGGGIMDFISRELDVECLPADIPEKFVVDVSSLDIGHHFRVGELEELPRVTILTEPDVVVAHVVVKRAEEVPAEEAEAEPGAEAEAAAPEEGAEDKDKPKKEADDKKSD